MLPLPLLTNANLGPNRLWIDVYKTVWGRALVKRTTKNRSVSRDPRLSPQVVLAVRSLTWTRLGRAQGP